MKKVENNNWLTSRLPDITYPWEVFKLKYQLLANGLVKQNRYLELYLQLITKNLEMQKVKFQTQEHHCIPVGIYVKSYITEFTLTKNDYRELAERLCEDTLTIHLTFADHTLAHWYLYMCAKTDQFRIANWKACLYSLKNFSPITIKQFFQKRQVKLLLSDTVYLQQLQANYTKILTKRAAKISQTKHKDS